MAEEIDVLTNGRGIYQLHGLRPGIYTVQGLYGESDGVRLVEVVRGQKSRANIALTSSGRRTSGVVELIVERNAVDTQTSSTGVETTGAELGKVQAGSSVSNGVYDKLISLSPTAREGPGGRSTTMGNSDLEQRYMLNDHDTSDPTMGAVGAQLISEFIASARVLEAGYEAEYGGASGGQFQATRLAGTNSFAGTAGLRFSPRLAAPRFILDTDEALRVTLVPEYGAAGYFVVSGPLVEDRLFFTLGLNVSGARQTLNQSFYHRIDRDGSGGYSGCPYQNGTNDCVDGGNFIATEKFAEQNFKMGGVQVGWIGGIDWQISPSHRLELTVNGGPKFSRTSYRLPFSVDPSSFGTNPSADPLGGGARVATGIVNGKFGTDLGIQNLVGLGYHGRVSDDRLEIDAQVSYWQGRSQMGWRLDDPTLRDRVATQEQSATGRNLIRYLDRDGRSADVSGVQEACNNRDIPGDSCPVRTWVSGGMGRHERDLARRVQGGLNFTVLFDTPRAGNHRLKWGGEASWLQRKSVYAYSGRNEDDFLGHGCDAGEVAGGEYCFDQGSGGYRFERGQRVNNNRFIVVDADNPGNRTSFGYGTVRHETGELRALADPLGRGARVAAYDESLSTLNYGLYLQDRWAPVSNLVLSAGVRWEIQDMRDIFGERQVLIADNVAPRLGVVYDWTDEGRSRLYASYGWFFQPLPLQLNSRVFGGLVQVQRSYQHGDCDNQVSTFGGQSHPRTQDGQPSEWCIDSGGSTTGLTQGSVAPGLKGPYNKQFELGYEQELIEDLVVNLRWVHQDLGRAVEDVSTNGGLDFVIANPGEAIAGAQVSRQERECAALGRELRGLSTDDDGRGQLARELQRCDFLVSAYRRLGDMFPKPVRTMDVWSLQLTRRFAKGWSLRASYTYARQVGNYDGYVDPSNGSVNLGASTQYDIPELVRNSFGPLSGTVPHMVNVDGIYSLDFRDNGRLTFGANFRYRSGVPVDVRADTGSAQYRGNFLVYLLPRGTAGRVGANYRVNLSASYSYPLGHDIELELVARIVNVTNARAILRVDDVYSFEGARAIAGGDLRDLKHAKVHQTGGGDGFFDRRIVRPQGNFGVETSFQQPVAGQFELAVRF